MATTCYAATLLSWRIFEDAELPQVSSSQLQAKPPVNDLGVKLYITLYYGVATTSRRKKLAN